MSQRLLQVFGDEPGHSHEHGHSHEQAQGARAVVLPGDAEAHRAPLARHSGRGQLLFLDAFSGIAGDMTIAALVDLGVPFDVVRASVALLGLDGFELSLKRARGGAIGGTQFDVIVSAAQPDRRYRAIDDLLDASELSPSVKALARRINPRWISDHLCWTGVSGLNVHDLLPMPYTDESLAHTIERVKTISDYLERPLILENPSTYLEFKSSTWREWDFIAELAERADCGLLLDVNHVYVSSFNHGFDPREYLDRIPAGRVVQIHLAGHTNKGTHILDTHSDHVIGEVWELYRRAYQRFGGIATLLEWDEAIPDFDTVHREALKAKDYRETREQHAA